MKRCLACDSRFEADAWTCPSCGHGPASRDGFLAFAPESADGTGEDAEYEYHALAAGEDAHFWFRGRTALLVWAVRRYFPGADSMLEIGCGAGGVGRAIRSTFPRMRLTATELLVRGLEFARRRLPDAQLLQMDAHRIPFDGEFDVIGAFDVIEHIDDDRGVLRAMHDAVKPGGGILITVPQHPSLWSPLDDFSRHRRRYTRRELRSKLESAGFRIRRMTSFVSILLPLLLASRRWDRPFDPGRELRIPAALNRMLMAISTLERLFIAAGISFPAGGSLLAVAVRPATTAPAPEGS